MIDAYKIGVALVLDQTKILGPLGEVISALERVQDIQKNVQGGINQMAAGYRAAAKGAQALADALERVNRAQAGSTGRGGAQPTFTGGIMVGPGAGTGGGSVPRAVSSRNYPLMIGGPAGTFAGGPGSAGMPAIPMAPRGSGGVDVPWGALAGGSAAGLTFSRGERPSASDAMMLGVGAGAVSYGSFDLVDKLFSAGLSVDAVKAGLLTQRFSDTQVSQALAKAKEAQRTVTGSSVGGNLEIVSMLMAMTQDADAAMRLMPAYSKLAVTLGASGHGDDLASLTSAMTGAELRGVLYKKVGGKEVLDEQALGNFLHMNIAANIMTHGRIGPREITQFLKSSGISGGMMSDQAMFADSLPLIMAMGPARAGTALQGFGQQFSSGKMSQAAMNLLAEMGIVVDKSRARKVGMGQFMLMPGAMKQGDVQMARDNPATFIMDRLLPRIDAYLQKNFGKEFSSADDKKRVQMEAGMFQQIASRIPGGNEMAETLRNFPLIQRDRDAAKKAMQVDAFGLQVANNPKVQLEAFHAALNGLMISLAEPNMKTGVSVLSDLTVALNRMSAWVDKNPDTARHLVDFATGLGIVSAAIAAAVPTVLFAAAAAKAAKWAIPAAAAGEGSGFLASAGATAASAASGIANFLGVGALGWEAGKGVAESPAWQKFGDKLDQIRDAIHKQHEAAKSKPVTMTGNLYIDSRRTGTYTAAGVQSGTTAFDSSMHPTPSGAPQGMGK